MIATIDFGHSPATENVPDHRRFIESADGWVCCCPNFSGGSGRQNNVTTVHTFNQAGQLTPLGFDIAVLC